MHRNDIDVHLAGWDSLKKKQKLAHSQWRRQGEHRERFSPHPPRNWKNCWRKMMLFPKALFLATTFSKIDKISIFLKNFYLKISKFSQNFPTICIFRPNLWRINDGFLIILLRIAKIMHFCYFLKRSLKICQKSTKQLCFSSKHAKV